MKAPSFAELVGALLALVAVGVVAWVAVATSNDTALGALIAITSAATGYFLRAKMAVHAP